MKKTATYKAGYWYAIVVGVLSLLVLWETPEQSGKEGELAPGAQRGATRVPASAVPSRKSTEAVTAPFETSPSCTADWNNLLAVGGGAALDDATDPAEYMAAIDEFRRSFTERASGWRCGTLPEGHPLTCAHEEFLDACEAFLPVPLNSGRLPSRLRRIKFNRCHRPGALVQAPPGKIHSPEEWSDWFKNRSEGARDAKQILQAVRCYGELVRYKQAIEEAGAKL